MQKVEAKIEQFNAKMVGILNGGALALMTSIGHQTGLFDTMAQLPAADPDRIAHASGLSARYVREWLAAMAVGGIVEHDPVAETYRLPPEHASCLTRAAGADNLATMMQMIAMLGEVEQRVVQAFRDGRGVPYSAYPRFHALMAEDSAQVMDATLLTRTLPLVPGLQTRLEDGIDVLDVGCGEGVALDRLARRFPRSRFCGIDVAEREIVKAQAQADRDGLTNLRFEIMDAATLSARGAYDLVLTFDAIHDQAKPQAVLDAIRQALRPDGVYLMVDIAASSHVHENIEHPFAAALYSISCMHCMSVSLAAGGDGLGAMWGEQTALEMLANAGFDDVRVERVEGDPLNSYYVALAHCLA